MMGYDADNRPLSVTFAGKTTCYVNGDDGARLKKRGAWRLIPTVLPYCQRSLQARGDTPSTERLVQEALVRRQRPFGDPQQP